MRERDKTKSWEDKVMFIGFYLISLSHYMSNITWSDIHYRSAVCLLFEFGFVLQALLIYNF